MKCDDIDTANTVKESMQQQWSDLVRLGCRVKVKAMIDAVVERTHFISQSSPLTAASYFYATAKADVKLTGSNSTKEYQFRDLLFSYYIRYVCVLPLPITPLVGVCIYYNNIIPSTPLLLALLH